MKKLKKSIVILGLLIIAIISTLSYADETNNTVTNSIDKNLIENLGNNIENKDNKITNVTSEKFLGNNIDVNNSNIVENEDNSISEDTNSEEIPNIDTKTIEDGIYEIHSSLDDTKLLDVEGQSFNSGANIYIYQRSNVPNQKFKFIYNKEDGTYTIISVNSGKAMDVQNGGTSNGTNVWQYELNETDAQKWIAIQNSDGTYSFMSKLKENLYLDIAGGGSNNCTNVQVYEENGSNAQKFRLVLQYELDKVTNIKDDTYNILVSESQKMGIDITSCSPDTTANVQLWTIDNNPAQKFKLTYNSVDSTYTIMAVNSGKVLDVANAGMTNYTNVWQYDMNGTDAQKWYIVKNTDDSYSFISKLNGLALDISGALFKNGTNVQVYEYNDSKAQKFILKGAYPMQGYKTIEDGVYELTTKWNISQSLDIVSGSTDENAELQLWTSNFTDAQKFIIKYIGDGYYKIISKVSGKALTVESTNPSIGSRIVQKTDEN